MVGGSLNGRFQWQIAVSGFSFIAATRTVPAILAGEVHLRDRIDDAIDFGWIDLTLATAVLDRDIDQRRVEPFRCGGKPQRRQCARILEAQGHGGFTTNAMAELAGVSIGTLYQYSPDRDALLGALIARETDRLVQEAEAACLMPEGRQALHALVQAAVRHQVHRPRLARLLDFEEARLPLDAGLKLLLAFFQLAYAS